MNKETIPTQCLQIHTKFSLPNFKIQKFVFIFESFTTLLKFFYLVQQFIVSLFKMSLTRIQTSFFKGLLEKLKEKTKRYASILGVNPQSVDLKEYKARWGSCSSSGDVTYNWRIIIAPHHIVDYIVVHELCHLLEHNHGPKYWKLVQSVVPNYREHREWLKVNGEGLRI